MSTESESAPHEPASESLAIYSINAYTHSLISSMASSLKLEPQHIQRLVLELHSEVVKELAAVGLDYRRLRWALEPRTSRIEAGFVFDSSVIDDGRYGYAIASAWIPALREHGPKVAAISVGDIYELPPAVLWRALDKTLIRPGDFPRLHPSQYFVVYVTNLSPTQLTAMDAAIRSSTPGYLGYVDCSTWTIFKAGLLLPQVGLRCGQVMITSADEEGTLNQVGYPFEDSGFRVVGIDENLCGILLDYKIDNGIPEWADEDSAIGFSALGGGREPISTIDLVIDESRIEYLRRAHGESLNKAGLGGLDKVELANAIKAKIAGGLIFHLRFVEGTHRGVRAPNNDAMMFSVQVELPDADGVIRRYQMGIKYRTATHVGEVVTFY